MPRVQKLYDGTETAEIDSSGNLMVKAAANSGVDIGDVTLTAGTAAFGKLAANSGVDIGDVDVTSISAGTNLIGKVSIDQVTANANEVVLKAGAASIGTLGANSGVDIGDVDVTSISAGTNLIGKVSIDQVTANANEVVLKAGTAAFGKLAANSGVDIGDVDVTSLPALATGANIVGSIGGLGLLVPASVYFDDAVTADVDAAVGANVALRLVGFVAREGAGAPALASGYIVNGPTGATATKIVPIALAASGMNSQWFGPEGIASPLGISIDWGVGDFDIAIYYKLVAVS
jgi:hypothetical protein